MKKLISFLLMVTILSAFQLQAQQTEWFSQYNRRIHMDFHTPVFESDILFSNFDAKRYIKILKDAHVNSLVTFAKDHHGNSYYNTTFGKKHPAMPTGLDMMGELIEEGHQNNMKILTYYSVGWLTPVELDKPEWMERDKNGKKMGTDGNLKHNTWNCICLNSPYIDEVVLPELKELASNYNMDGFWIDIIENNACYCEWCTSKFKNQHRRGYHNHEEALAFSEKTRYQAMEKIIKTIKKEKPEALVSYNTAGRDKNLVPLVDFCSIETHPGATWHQGAWTHALLTMKYLQQFNKPWESTTSRFIHGWGGWDDQTEENMKAVAARITAHGGVINLGDQTYPTGALDGALYEKIGNVFAFINKMDDQTIGASPYSEIGLFTTDFDIYSIYANPGTIDNYLGATKILSDKKWSFDVLDENTANNLSQYKCIVLPNVGKLGEKALQQIKEYVLNGGNILVTGNSSLLVEKNNLQLSEILGVSYSGKSNYSVGYFDLKPEVQQNLRKSPLLVPGQFNEITPHEGTKVLSGHIYPVIQPEPESLFFFRNTELSPPGKPSGSPAIVLNNYGKGKAIYVAAPLFEAFKSQGQWYLKDVAQNLLNLLVKEKDIDVYAPDNVEVFPVKKDGKLVISLINYMLHNETNQVEEVIPLHDIKIRVKKELIAENSPPKIIGNHTGYSMDEDGGFLTINLDRLYIYSQVILQLR